MTATTEHAVVHAIRSIQLLGETWPSWALRPMCTKILVLDIKGRRKNANRRPILARPPRLKVQPVQLENGVLEQIVWCCTICMYPW